MASVNKVIIVGNLGRDPETRYLPSGDAVSNINVATTDRYKDKATGEMKEATEWHRISFFGKLAEIAGQYLKKGSQVYVEGSLRTRKYTDKDGVEKFATEIRGETMQMLGGRQGGGAPMGGGQPAGEQQGGWGQPQQPQASNQFSGSQQSQNSRPAQNTPPAASSNEPPMDFDDDIPF